MKHHETFCIQLSVPHWGVGLCLRANSPRRISGDITQDNFGHWMRQLLPQSRRTMADSPTHLIKYLMQTLFHAWLSACAVHCSLCVCLCVCWEGERARGCTAIFCHYIALIKSCLTVLSLALPRFFPLPLHTHTHADEASSVQLALPIAMGSEPLWGTALWVLLDTKAIRSVED